ncbi:MAG: porin [Pseudomonadota bacterium]
MKHLYLTTTIVTLLAVPSYAADPITASVGGFAGIGLLYQNNDLDPEIGIINDGEVQFKFKGTSDNGLTFDGRVELEAFTTGDQIDEYYARVSGSFGAILIGADDSSADAFVTGFFEPPATYIGYMASEQGIFDSSTGGDVPAIRYTTPEISGFSASVDWAPDATADGGDGVTGQQITFGEETQRYSLGLGWSGSFSGIEIEVGGGFIDEEDGPESWVLGGIVGYEGVKFGAYYDEDGLDGEFSSLSIGLEYDTGSWTFAGGWSMALDGDDYNSWAIWANYALAPGVTLTLGYEGNDDSDRTGGFDTTIAAYAYIAY